MMKLGKFLIRATLVLLSPALPAAAQNADPVAAADGAVLRIQATTSAGEEVKAKGVMRSRDGLSLEIVSDEPLALEPGEYPLRIGIETHNGSLYRPVARRIQVTSGGETLLGVVVEEPPSVTARFVENGKERGDGPYFENHVAAFQNGKQIFHFSAGKRIYVDEGEYSFHSTPNPENEDLTVRTSLAAGDHKVITFEMVHTVHAVLKMVAAGSGIDFRRNYELWRDGKPVKPVHWTHGAWATPGTYDLRLPDKLTPYVHRGIVLEAGRKNEIRVEVSAGYLKVIYQETDGMHMDDERITVARVDPDDPSVASRTVTRKKSGEVIPLTAGRYRVEGWSHLGNFEAIEVDVEVGENVEVVLRDQG